MSKIVRGVYMQEQEPRQHAIVTRDMPKTIQGPIARALRDEELTLCGIVALVADVVPHTGSVIHKSYGCTRGYDHLGKALDRVCPACSHYGRGRRCIADGVDATLCGSCRECDVHSCIRCDHNDVILGAGQERRSTYKHAHVL